MSLPTVYSVSTLLDMLPISRNTLYAALERGELVGTKVGSKWLIPEPNVLAWLNVSEDDEAPDIPAEGNVSILPTTGLHYGGSA